MLIRKIEIELSH